MTPPEANQLDVVSLFSGAGGLDLGLAQAGHRIVGLCESWEPARRVLAAHDYQRVHEDVASFEPGVRYDALVAGFPCTNLSQVGDRSGLAGSASGLVSHVFRIAEQTRPSWVILENVPNLLRIHKGSAMTHIVGELESLGYRWAYRTVDSRFTGVPQRRLRVVILASLDTDPAPALLGTSVELHLPERSDDAWGFYWTEGRHGVGLIRNAVPTIKAGSTLGITSAPAVWRPTDSPGRKIVIPSVEQGEVLQGFPSSWTSAAVVDGERDMRWRLIGNAVTVGVGSWIGRIIASSSNPHPLGITSPGESIDRSQRWPAAGWGSSGHSWSSEASYWPEQAAGLRLTDVVNNQSRPLSHKATSGFLSRLSESNIPINKQLYADLEEHLAATRKPTSNRARKLSWASAPHVRDRMRATPQRDTKPELAIRRALTARGVRYRLQNRPEPDLRWRMDIVFRGPKIGVDIRGCFWHSCPVHGTAPRANRERWAKKLAENVERDQRIVDALTARGWTILVIWEHEDPEEAAAIIEHAVRTKGRSRKVRSLGAN